MGKISYFILFVKLIRLQLCHLPTLLQTLQGLFDSGQQGLNRFGTLNQRFIPFSTLMARLNILSL